MRKYLILLYFISYIGVVFGQGEKGHLEIKGTIRIDREALSGAKVDVFQNGTKTITYTCDMGGKFEGVIELNKEYNLTVRKEGFFSKILYINTSVPPEDAGIYSYRFGMELFPFIENFDASLLKEPIGKIEFVEDFGDFDYDQAYTKAQQKKLAAMMRDYEKSREEYWNQVINQADDAFKSKDYELAQSLYNKAIELDPYDPYPDDQLYQIGKVLSKDQKNQGKYDETIALADRQLSAEAYDLAKKTYNKAILLMDKQYPKDKIAYIDDFLSKNANEAAELAAIEKAYSDAILAADRLLANKSYESSLEKYNVALGVKPEMQYPKDKITEINGILALLASNAKNQAEIDRQYKLAIAAADTEFSQKTYEQSRVNFVKASQLKPAEDYPKSKISEIDNLLVHNKTLDAKYKGIIARADRSFGTKDYKGAKSIYQEALTVKPNEAYPKDKISEIDGLLLAMLAKDKQGKEDAYNQAIAQGDSNFGTKSYSEAKTFYLQASSIKNSETYPKQKVIEIDRLLAEQANKKQAYDQAIAQADNQFNANSWEGAKINYQKALAIFPAESYPQTRLNEIENKLLAMKSANDQKAAREKAYNDAIVAADSFFGEKKYQESKNSYSQALSIKTNEQYPKTKIEEIERLLLAQKALNDRYNGMIATADTYFTDKNYSNAKTTYTNALGLKPTEQYPKDKISEIDVILAQLAAGNKKRKELQKQYDSFIFQADGAFDMKEWEQAKSLYSQASAVLPEEVYPKQRITEITNMLAGYAARNKKYSDAIAMGDNLFGQKQYGEAMSSYNTALSIKANEAYPKTKITEIQSILGKLQADEAAYDNFITLADQAFSSNELTDAKSQYQGAAAIKPTEDYPKKRIAEIDALLEEQRLLLANKNKLDAQYNTLISSADNYMNQKQYEQAKIDYQKASQLKSQETYPKQKLMDIDDILGTLAAANTAYSAAIAKGKQLFDQKNLAGALNSYTQASSIKPNEQMPKQKITEINGILAKQKQDRKNYDGLISQADVLFNSNEYEAAKGLYQNASVIYTGEAYPKNQITKIDQILQEQARLAGEQKVILAQYSKKIAEADKFFNAKSYDDAISAYMDAKSIKADESYPNTQIAKVNQLIQADKAKLEANYKKAIQNGTGLVSQKKYSDAKSQFELALSLKPNDQLAKTKLVELENLVANEQAEQAKMAEINKKYNQFITQADNAFKAKDYSSAMAMYKSAGNVKRSERYPKDQVEICEQKMRDQSALASAEAEKKRQAEIAAAAKSFEAEGFDYSGEDRDRDFLNDLAKKYPEGVTIENYNKPNKKIKRIIVNRGGIAKEYIEVKYSYGTYYFRNGQNISRGIFYSEAK